MEDGTNLTDTFHSRALRTQVSFALPCKDEDRAAQAQRGGRLLLMRARDRTSSARRAASFLYCTEVQARELMDRGQGGFHAPE